MVGESSNTGDAKGWFPEEELIPESSQATEETRHLSLRPEKPRLPGYSLDDMGEGQISQHSDPSQRLSAASKQHQDPPRSKWSLPQEIKKGDEMKQDEEDEGRNQEARDEFKNRKT